SGRAILGIGAAWHDVEHTSYGVDFPSVAERLDMLEEAVQICRLMFEEDAPTFEGRYFSIHDAFNFPRPIQAGGPPILVGGGGERRTLKIAATYADACNVFGNVSVVRRKIDVLTRHCERIGRDPSEICKTRLSALVVAENNSKASDKLEKLARARNYDDMQLSTVVWGDPQTVAEKSRQYIDAGLDGLIFNFPDPVSTDDIELAGEALRHLCNDK
ncbi:MAG: LLM class flavin-dependent oxidoreductase, partial [Actinobacteria bacterium]|nr:LLM class flavin-dependent oxidoreductase [Actinomycetota bacterium]